MSSQFNPSEFGANVRRLRKMSGLTLPQLAADAKLSRGTLSKIENGKGNPTYSTINSLAIALGVEIKDLI